MSLEAGFQSLKTHYFYLVSSVYTCSLSCEVSASCSSHTPATCWPISPLQPQLKQSPSVGCRVMMFVCTLLGHDVLSQQQEST